MCCVYLKVTVDRPWDKDKAVNSAVDRGVMRDLQHGKEVVNYAVETRLEANDVARIVQATQTALGISPGGVSLAQNYAELFRHRIKNAEDITELNHALMAAIKAKEVKRVIELLNEGASPNFKEEVPEGPLTSPRKGEVSSPAGKGGLGVGGVGGAGGAAPVKHFWTPLIRACSARIDTGDLGMNFLATNQIIEVLIRAGADVAQVNDYGRTALHYAAMQGNYYACTVLVHAGAPVDAKGYQCVLNVFLMCS